MKAATLTVMMYAASATSGCAQATVRIPFFAAAPAKRPLDCLQFFFYRAAPAAWIAVSGAGGVDPLRMPPGTPEGVDWAEARRAYELGGLSVPDIRSLFGLTPYQFRRARELGGWATRNPAARRAPVLADLPPPPPTLATELVKNFRAQLARLNERVAAGAEIDDREARTLFELCRVWSVMKQTRTGKAAPKAARDGGLTKKNNNAGTDLTEDPDWLRDRLRERIERLRESNRPGDAGGGPQDPHS